MKKKFRRENAVNALDIAKSVPVFVTSNPCTRMVIYAPVWRFFWQRIFSQMPTRRAFGAYIALNTDLDQGFVGLSAKRFTLCMVIRA
ncbi:hypothetical protein [Kosakonia sp. YIM B13611]|uniref:hypothetical protein n=1 Tax=unclassified Kosakonia TaxID=2632876 RepID=UPI00368F4A1A